MMVVASYSPALVFISVVRSGCSSQGFLLMSWWRDGVVVVTENAIVLKLQPGFLFRTKING